MTLGLLACGFAALATTRGLAQQPTALPERGGQIVLVGCLQHEIVKKHEKWVLVSPTVGYATSVPDANCSFTNLDGAVELKEGAKLDTSLIGHWVEMRGRLESIEGPDDLRELHVIVYRQVPVAAPLGAEAMPALPQFEPAPPAPAVEAFAPAESAAPVATAGVTEAALPTTASSLSRTGLIGLVAAACGASLLLLRRRRRIERG